MSVALYLATYFDANTESKAFYKKNKDDLNLRAFCVEDYSRQPFNKKFLPKIQKNKDKYKAYMVRAEGGDEKMLSKLLNNKKLFSPPWLICPDVLMLQHKLEEGLPP
jgi:hypothetical protein